MLSPPLPALSGWHWNDTTTPLWVDSAHNGVKVLADPATRLMAALSSE